MHVIRLARPEDAGAISALDDKIFVDEGLSEATIHRELVAGVGLVAESGTDLLGYALLRPGVVGDLLRLGVKEEARGEGIGQDMLRRVLRHAPGRCILTVRKHNQRAQKLYRSFGFHVVAQLESSWLMARQSPKT